VKIVVGISGSSGVIYGVRLLRALPSPKVLIVSPTASKILDMEAAVRVDELKAFADETYDDSDLFSPTSSGSNLFDAMIICPCSESTVAKIACGIADTLITRTAAVALKDARSKGLKVGMLRPLTLWPFPEAIVRKLGKQVKAIVVPECNLGQMLYEVERVARCQGPVVGVHRLGGVPIYPGEILDKLEEVAR